MTSVTSQAIQSVDPADPVDPGHRRRRQRPFTLHVPVRWQKKRKLHSPQFEFWNFVDLIQFDWIESNGSFNSFQFNCIICSGDELFIRVFTFLRRRRRRFMTARIDPGEPRRIFKQPKESLIVSENARESRRIPKNPKESSSTLSLKSF